MIQLANIVIPNSYINNNIVSKIQSRIGEVYKKQFLKTSNTRGRRQWHPTPVLLPGNRNSSTPPMDGGAWWAAVHGVAKSQTRLSDFTFTFHFHALEKEMAPHSSVLAWRIPWTEKTDRLQSMGSHRVGHE